MDGLGLHNFTLFLDVSWFHKRFVYGGSAKPQHVCLLAYQDELADASVYTNSVDKDELVFIVDFGF